MNDHLFQILHENKVVSRVSEVSCSCDFISISLVNIINTVKSVLVRLVSILNRNDLVKMIHLDCFLNNLQLKEIYLVNFFIKPCGVLPTWFRGLSLTRTQRVFPSVASDVSHSVLGRHFNILLILGSASKVEKCFSPTRAFFD